MEAESLLLSVVTKLLNRYTDTCPEIKNYKQLHRAVRQVREYIETYYAENISLQQLAKLVNLNQFHLADVFCKEVGLPPHAYLNQVRIQRAKQLILSGESIAQVAHDTGFVDQSHLTRRFKRIVGCTPGRLLRYQS